MLEISKNPMALVVRRNVGKFIAVVDISSAISCLRKNNIFASVISIGMSGEADVQGFIGGQICKYCESPIHPKPFALEVKTAKGKQRDEQVSWQQNVWERRGGLYILGRNLSDIKEL